jgi:urea carboxylase
VGTVNFTGTMPIVITADGPSLGGFICLATIPTAELWKIGQARAADTIRFRRMEVGEAVRARRLQEKILAR